MVAADSGKPTRRLYFFLGAGASVPAGVPDTVGLLTGYRRSLPEDSPLRATLAAAESLVRTWLSRTGRREEPVSVEHVLEACSFAISEGDVGAALLTVADIEQIGSPTDIRALTNGLHSFIRERCIVKPSATDRLDGFYPFLIAGQEIHIFTVNYDNVVEALLSKFGVTPLDGFRQSWDASLFDGPPANTPKVCLYKLHGSVDWYRSKTLGYLRLPVLSAQGSLLLNDGTTASPLLMYPARKWEYSGPFVDLLRRFYGALSDCDWITIVGYRFRDDHLNRVIRDAIRENPRLQIVLISPHAEQVYREVLADPEFGWPTEDEPEAVPSDSGAAGPGRVVRIPYKWERYVRDYAATQLTRIQLAVSRYWDAITRQQTSEVKDWDSILSDLVSVGLTDYASAAEPKVDFESKAEDWIAAIHAQALANYVAVPDMESARSRWTKLEAILREWFVQRAELHWMNGVTTLTFTTKFLGIAAGLPTPSGFAVAPVGWSLGGILQAVHGMGANLQRIRDYIGPDDKLDRFGVLDNLCLRLSKFEGYLQAFSPTAGSLTLEQYLSARESSNAEDVASIRADLALLSQEPRITLDPASMPNRDALERRIKLRASEMERHYADHLLFSGEDPFRSDPPATGTMPAS